MIIRSAREQDMPRLLEIYEIARSTMRASGNLHQWNNGYPSEEVLREDITLGRLYVMEQDGQAEAAFVFFVGVEPTYARIEGAWLTDRPYGVIHRVASSGAIRGVVPTMVAWCRERAEELRIDTHADNTIMQRQVERSGFARCGIIYLENGDPRIAYQLC